MAFIQTAFSDFQPYLVLNQVIVKSGSNPASGADGDTIGVIYQFAGTAANVAGWIGAAQAQGQTASKSTDAGLFGVVGARYGASTASTFTLPNLSGQLAIGIGTGSGLTEGTAVGSSTVTLTVAQMPTSSGPASTGFENREPSLPIQYIVCTSGNFPSSGGADFPFLGQIMPFAGNTIPTGWAACDGSSLSVSANAALFSVLGTRYGGNGTTTFALPNLIGRVPVGFTVSRPIGTAFGEASTQLTAIQIPVAAAVPGVTGLGATVTNDQPSLSVEYLIATTGLFPSSGSTFDTTTPFIGQVVAFAGNFIPAGYALANGATLQIGANQALFALIGTTYGGNGVTTFALPNLTGRAIVGAGTQSGTTYAVGQTAGVDSFTLTGGNLPPADQICFLPGTLIRTPTGQTEVETLVPGDYVQTLGGEARPIVWVGKGTVLATRYKRGPATPVIVRKGALGPNLPHTDLRVTKGHSFFIDGVLVPVEFLVNHRSIEWDDRAQEVTIYHVELETHDVLIANGAPVESYRDDGNRRLFRNANHGWSQPPKPPCAPIVTGGPIVDAIWQRLLARA
ncbi:MAG: tail fiber protein, partial [Rhodospirillales bacterium]